MRKAKSLIEKIRENMARPAPKAGDLRVWHIPQIPGKPFLVPVANIVEGKLLLDALAHYDLFQFENRIKPDYANGGVLNVFEDGEWTDWPGFECPPEVEVACPGVNDIHDLTLAQVRELHAAITKR